MRHSERSTVAHLLELGRHVEARGRLAHMIAQAPDDPELLMLDAQAAVQSGDVRAARRAADRAVSVAPDSPMAHRVLAMARLVSGNDRAAVKAAKEYVRLAPNSPDAHGVLAQCAVGLPYHRRTARRAVARALELDPTDPDHLTLQGMVHQDRRRHRRARETYLEALRIDPEHTDARTQLASLDNARRPARAAREYTRILADDPLARLPRLQITRLVDRPVRRLYWGSLVTMLVITTMQIFGRHAAIPLVGSVALVLAVAYAGFRWFRLPRPIRRFLPAHARRDPTLLVTVVISAVLLAWVGALVAFPRAGFLGEWGVRVGGMLGAAYWAATRDRGRTG